MHLTEADIQATESIHRLNLINALSGLKPANLIGTQSGEGILNLTIFSSVIHLGSNPALFGMILRPNQDVRRDTFSNIQETGYYTINHVHESFIKRAHFTSAKFPSEASEFEQCDLTPEWLADFPAPFVKESKIKLGLRWEESVPISLNNTMLIIGKVQQLFLADECLEEGWHVNLEKAGAIGLSGLNSYYQVQKKAQYPYARTEELPESWE